MNHEKIAALMKDALSFEINTNFLSVSNFRRDFETFFVLSNLVLLPSPPPLTHSPSNFPHTFLSNFQNFINLLSKVRQTKSFQLIMVSFVSALSRENYIRISFKVTALNCETGYDFFYAPCRSNK